MSFSSFMNMPMTIYNASGTDKFAKHTFSSGTDTFGRFRQTNDTLITAQNEVEPIHGVVQLEPSETVAVGDKITYNSTDYRVMTKMISVGGKGNPHHLELKVQEWSI